MERKRKRAKAEETDEDSKIRPAVPVSVASHAPRTGPDLVMRLKKAPYSVVLCPVLFIHADNDSVIDYHHSVTLHQRRVKDKLSSELYTQRSNHWVKKDHNRFDYQIDYLDPVRAFLQRKVSVGGGGMGVVLDTSVLLQHCIIPAQYRARHTKCLSERAMKKTQSFKQSEVKKSNPRKGGPLGVVELIVNGCTLSLCCRCCCTCLPGFCIECVVALCKAGTEGTYTALVDDETDFTYTTKSQRRDSGDGLSVGSQRSASRRGDEVVALEQPSDQTMESREHDKVKSDTEAKERIALEKEARDAGKKTEAVGIFERFAGLMSRPAEGQVQAAEGGEQKLDYVPG